MKKNIKTLEPILDLEDLLYLGFYVKCAHLILKYFFHKILKYLGMMIKFVDPIKLMALIVPCVPSTTFIYVIFLNRKYFFY
jgi:hypothetical protein